MYEKKIFLISYFILLLLLGCKEINENISVSSRQKTTVCMLRKKNDHLNDDPFVSDKEKFNNYNRKECKLGFWYNSWTFYKLLFFNMKDGNSYVTKYAYDSWPYVGSNRKQTGAVCIWLEKDRNAFIKALINTFGEKEFEKMIAHDVEIPYEYKNSVMCIESMDDVKPRKRVFFITADEYKNFMKSHPNTKILSA